MPDSTAAVRKLLADLHIPEDQKVQDLGDALKTRLLEEVEGRLRDLIADYDDVIPELQASEDPHGELAEFVKGVLEDWLASKGISPSDKLADALMKAFADPGSVFAKDEWLSMPPRAVAGKLKYYRYLQSFRAFVFEWGHDILGSGSRTSDPQARPNVFSAAATVQLDTSLVTLACGTASPDPGRIEDWLRAVTMWGVIKYGLSETPGWLSSVTASAVAGGDHDVRQVIDLIAWGAHSNE
jgi:hypothetical protein